MEKHYSHSATILPVTDVKQTAEYYEQVLGFTIEFLWEDPPSYAVLKANENISIHLSRHDTIAPGRKAALYIFVSEIDEFYETLKRRGARITAEIGDRDYQMRDFDIEDPNGYQITFGCALELVR